MSNTGIFTFQKQNVITTSLILLTTLFTNTIFAADMIYLGKDESDPYYTRFKVKLDGPVEKGDKVKLEKLVNDIDLGGVVRPDYGYLLFLDSTGGSLTEGLKIVEYVHDEAIATYIDRGAKCFSACSLIFMAGTYVFKDVSIDRTLHIGGQLGFHAPYLPADVSIGYNNAIRHVAKIFDLFDKQGGKSDAKPLMKQSLLLRLLSKGPEELLNIDTIDKAGRWDIELTGIPQIPIESITENELWQACKNNIAWTYDLDYVPEENMTMKIHKDQRDNWDGTYTPVAKVRIFIAGTQASGLIVDTGCDITLAQNPGGFGSRINGGIWQGVQPSQYYDVGPIHYEWNMFPSSTLLQDLL